LSVPSMAHMQLLRRLIKKPGSGGIQSSRTASSGGSVKTWKTLSPLTINSPNNPHLQVTLPYCSVQQKSC